MPPYISWLFSLKPISEVGEGFYYKSINLMGKHFY